MSDQRRIQVGVFRSLEGADTAVAALVDSGFAKDQITVICPTCAVEEFPGTHREKPSGARTPRAIATGGAIGALLGGLSVVGIAASGGTALLVAGPLLGGAATGGILGSFVGAMMTRGLEHEVADFYDQSLRKGSILVAVETSPDDIGRGEAARAIFADSGAEAVELRKS
jgi:hypothetical protein